MHYVASYESHDFPFPLSLVHHLWVCSSELSDSGPHAKISRNSSIFEGIDSCPISEVFGWVKYKGKSIPMV
jgi:hypothetical protein